MARRSNEELRKLPQNRERQRGNVPDHWFDFPLTRSEAKKEDLRYFFSGVPCQKGHIALRWTSSSKCLECAGYNDIPSAIKRYSEEEDEYLRQNYKTQNKEQMAEALGRTKKSVEKRLLSVLGLTIDMETRDSIRKQNNVDRNTQHREKYRGQVPDQWFDLPPSQEEGERLGSDYFFTGLPCERGHIDIRGTNHRRCLACNRENSIESNQDLSIKEWRRDYKKRDYVRKQDNETKNKRFREDPVFRLRVNTSSRIANFFAGRKSAGKQEKTEELLGCSYEDFHKWISSQLNGGMTMENYGLNGWHLDHVRPVMSFRDKHIDVDVEVQRVAFNWRNYQPLWGDENKSKNDDWTPSMEKVWIERMRSLGWDGKIFPCFGDEP